MKEQSLGKHNRTNVYHWKPTLTRRRKAAQLVIGLGTNVKTLKPGTPEDRHVAHSVFHYTNVSGNVRFVPELTPTTPPASKLLPRLPRGGNKCLWVGRATSS